MKNLLLICFLLIPTLNIVLSSQQDFDVINNYGEGLTKAKEETKPIFLLFTTKYCENKVDIKDLAISTDVFELLNEKYVTVVLHVDDKTKLPKVENLVVDGYERQIRTEGQKWAIMEMTKFNRNDQPMITVIDFKENEIQTPFNLNIEGVNLKKYLETGLEKFNND